MCGINLNKNSLVLCYLLEFVIYGNKISFQIWRLPNPLILFLYWLRSTFDCQFWTRKRTRKSSVHSQVILRLTAAEHRVMFLLSFRTIDGRNLYVENSIKLYEKCLRPLFYACLLCNYSLPGEIERT